MLKNLIPEFIDVLGSSNREAAYHRYFESHRAVLSAYWNNYVLDPESPYADEVIGATLRADRSDLRGALRDVKFSDIAQTAISKSIEVLGVDNQTDVYLMVGVGAANAAEVVVNGRPAVVICVEHFTGKVNPSTYGLGLSPHQIDLWIAHTLAHTVRYTSPNSQSVLRRLIHESGGYYDCWAIAGRAPLKELLLNEGLAVHASMEIAPGHDLADYFGYPKRQFQRMRELEAFLRRAAHHDLERSGLGLRLRFLSGGLAPASRLALGRVLPERSGYYLGYRMAEALVSSVGIPTALRTNANDFDLIGAEVRDIRSA